MSSYELVVKNTDGVLNCGNNNGSQRYRDQYISKILDKIDYKTKEYEWQTHKLKYMWIKIDDNRNTKIRQKTTIVL